jgi:hypothetical protein
MHDGGTLTGLLKKDGATSLTLMQPSGVEQVLLRKDVRGVRRLAASLMPSFAETLKPSDLADLIAWLRSNLKAAAPTAAERSERACAIATFGSPKNLILLTTDSV